MTPPPDAQAPPPRRRAGSFVEGVRLIILALFAAAGWVVAENRSWEGRNLALAIVLASLTGYVVGGVFGRTTASAMDVVERRFRRSSAAEILGGTLGLILGLVIALLVSLLLLRLPPVAGWTSAAFTYLVLGFLGLRVGRSKYADFFLLFGMKPRAAGSSAGEVSVVDTSALVDGRIVEIARAGFLGGTLLVADGVLHELRLIGDASDPARRGRGRRGLEAVRALQTHPALDVVMVEGVPTSTGGDVDAGLVALARERGGVLITNDAQLAKVAEAVGVQVRSVSRLASSLRSALAVGDELDLTITRRGKDAGQGVAFLDDGTMVVIEQAEPRLGQEVHVAVTNVITTANGRMAFANLVGGEA